MMTPTRVSNEDMAIIAKIATRAFKVPVIRNKCYPEKICLVMDLALAHQETGLKLEEFLAAENLAFTITIVGIYWNLDRTTGKMMNSFTPKYAR